jgi:GGDEF domain-containing protein
MREQACPGGTYNPFSQSGTRGACLPCGLGSFCTEGSIQEQRCPDLFTTDSTVLAASVADCICDAGTFLFYENGTKRCAHCPVGVACLEPGATLTNLPLKRGYFRAASDTAEVRRCSDASVNCPAEMATTSCNESYSGCNGGTDFGTQCVDGLKGIYCTACQNKTGNYYQRATVDQPAACKACTGANVFGATILGTIALLVGIGVVLSRQLLKKAKIEERLRERLRGMTHTRYIIGRLGLSTKLKLLIAFFQIATAVDKVYKVSMPDSVNSLLVRTKLIISLGFDNVGVPLECMSYHGYYYLLLGWTIIPVLLCISYIVVFAGIAEVQYFLGLTANQQEVFSIRRVLLECLPTVLRIFFLAYPLVSTVAFRAFEFEDFGEAGAFLVSDYSVEKESEDYAAIYPLAIVAIVLYPLGIPLLYSALLFKARVAIQTGRQSPLSKATLFLHKDYKPAFYWWELVEIFRRFIFVGVAVVIKPGSLLQLLAATLMALLLLDFQHKMHPLRRKSDEAVAASANLSLVVLFICCMLLKLGQLTDVPEVRGVLTNAVADTYEIYKEQLSALLIITIISSILIGVFLLFFSLSKETIFYRNFSDDHKTHLSNASRFYKDLRELIELRGGALDLLDQRAAHVEGSAFIMAKMQGLKAINNRIGFNAGDQALVVYGALLLKEMRKFEASFARLRGYHLGGGDFTLICERESTDSSAEFEGSIIELVTHLAAEVTYTAKGLRTDQDSVPSRTAALIAPQLETATLVSAEKSVLGEGSLAGDKRASRESSGSQPEGSRKAARTSVLPELKQLAAHRYRRKSVTTSQRVTVPTFLRIGAGRSWKEARLAETAVRTHIFSNMFGSLDVHGACIAGGLDEVRSTGIANWKVAWSLDTFTSALLGGEPSGKDASLGGEMSSKSLRERTAALARENELSHKVASLHEETRTLQDENRRLQEELQRLSAQTCENDPSTAVPDDVTHDIVDDSLPIASLEMPQPPVLPPPSAVVDAPSRSARDDDSGTANTNGLGLSELSHRLTNALQRFSLDRFSSLSPEWRPSSFEESQAEAESPNADEVQADSVGSTDTTGPSQTTWEPERKTVTVRETVTTVRKTETVTVRSPQPTRSGRVREQLLDLRRRKDEGLLSENDFTAQRAIILAQRTSDTPTEQRSSGPVPVPVPVDAPQAQESVLHAPSHERRSHLGEHLEETKGAMNSAGRSTQRHGEHEAPPSARLRPSRLPSKKQTKRQTQAVSPRLEVKDGIRTVTPTLPATDSVSRGSQGVDRSACRSNSVVL